MTLSLGTAYRSFGGEVEASSTPTICRLPDSRRHQLSAIARLHTNSFSYAGHYAETANRLIPAQTRGKEMEAKKWKHRCHIKLVGRVLKSGDCRRRKRALRLTSEMGHSRRFDYLTATS